MSQAWNLKSRSHECARTARPFVEGETFYTAIYFDTANGEFIRRDVSLEAWEEETAERTPFSSWKAEYVKPDSQHKPKMEIVGKESAEALLRRLVEEDLSHTEHARYILALMLERKRQLTPKEVKYTEHGTMLLYENKKSGEIYIIRDPELRLDEIEAVQEEVAMLLGFGGPAAEAAAAVGMKFTPEGKLEKADAAEPVAPAAAEAEAPQPAAEPEPEAKPETEPADQPSS